MNYNTRTRPRHRQQYFNTPTLTSIFNDIFNTPVNEVVAKSSQRRRPAVNIAKNENGYTLMLAVPGVSKEDININIEDKKLVISTAAKSKDETNYRLREFNYDTFSRSFNLPKDIDTNSISADYESGVLTLTLPMSPESKPKSIKIK